jgi:hypothetical protein
MKDAYTTAAPHANRLVGGARDVLSQSSTTAAHVIITQGGEVKEAVENKMNESYTTAAPKVIRLAGRAHDVLSQVTSEIKPPKFDATAAKNALNFVGTLGMVSATAVGAGATAAATGCSAIFSFDILKFEIFRDFYQFLGIFFQYMTLPPSFEAFFGNLAALFSASFTSLISYAGDFAPSPLGWYWTVFVFTFVFWILLCISSPTTSKESTELISKKSLKKGEWTEINKTSTGKCSKFNKVKYSVLALTSLYVPLTKNSTEMLLCSPKYAYSLWECVPNVTNAHRPLAGHQFYAAPQELLEVQTCVDRLVMSSERFVLGKASDYKVISSGTCGGPSNSNTTVTYTEEQCRKAFLAIGYDPVINNTEQITVDNIVDQPENIVVAGCYFDGVPRFNPNNQSTVECTPKSRCLCRVPLACDGISLKSEKRTFALSENGNCKTWNRKYKSIENMEDCHIATTALCLDNPQPTMQGGGASKPHGCFQQNLNGELQVQFNPTHDTFKICGDVGTTCICETTPSSSTEDLCYEETKSGTCTSSNQTLISTAEECSKAASALGLTDVHVQSDDQKEHYFEPAGCFYKRYHANHGGRLNFNTGNGRTGPNRDGPENVCQDSSTCICKRCKCDATCAAEQARKEEEEKNKVSITCDGSLLNVYNADKTSGNTEITAKSVGSTVDFTCRYSTDIATFTCNSDGSFGDPVWSDGSSCPVPACYGLFTSGYCDSPDKIKLASTQECDNAAKKLGLSDEESFLITSNRASYPSGCYFQSNGFLIMNTYTLGQSCSSTNRCVCKLMSDCIEDESDQSHQSTEPCYIKYTSDTCQNQGKDKIASISDCEAAARDLGINKGSINTRDTGFWPPGCSVTSSELRYNERSSNLEACSENEYCLCKERTCKRRRRRTDGIQNKISTEMAFPAKDYIRNRGVCLSCPPNSLKYNDDIPVPKEGYYTKLIVQTSFPNGCHGEEHLGMVLVSCFVILLFSCYFPFSLSVIISKEKPRPMDVDDPENPVFQEPKIPALSYGKTTLPQYYLDQKELYDRLHGKPVIFNDEGKLVEYTDTIYAIEVAKKKDSPFTSLYSGYEILWSKYKINVMQLKFFQIFIMSLSTCDILARSVLTPTQSSLFASFAALISTGLFLFLTSRSTPYIDPINDKMEIVSKVTLIVTPFVVVLVVVFVPAMTSIVYVGVFLNICAFIGNVGMIYLMLSQMAFCKTLTKKCMGRLDFTDPDGISEYTDKTKLPEWDLDVERKRRIWKPFWDMAFSQCSERSGMRNENDNKEKQGAAKIKPENKWLKECIAHDGSDIPFARNRLEEMLSRLRVRGFEAFESGVMPLSNDDFQLRIHFQSLFEGE